LFAFIKALTLDSLATVTAKLLDGGVLAFSAGHGDSPLALSGEKPENTNWDWYCGLPRDAGLVPAAVEAVAGTHQSVEGLGWWFDRDIYGVTDSGKANRDRDSHAVFILSESPVAAGLSHLGQKSFFVFPVRNCRVLPTQVNHPFAHTHLSVGSLVFFDLSRLRESFQHSVNRSKQVLLRREP
jgi:hypothetical protein